METEEGDWDIGKSEVNAGVEEEELSGLRGEDTEATPLPRGSRAAEEWRWEVAEEMIEEEERTCVWMGGGRDFIWSEGGVRRWCLDASTGVVGLKCGGVA